MPLAEPNDQDWEFLEEAMSIAASADWNERYTPFGAVVVLDGRITGRGISSVVKLRDPTAHAEVMALREAAANRGTHLLSGAALYSSCEPCPLCLSACYWAGITRLVYAATRDDSAEFGFEDRFYYTQLALPNQQRVVLDEVAVSGAARDQARKALAGWRRQFAAVSNRAADK